LEDPLRKQARKEISMLRTMGLLMLVGMFAVAAPSADLVSMKVCSLKDCPEGSAIEGTASTGVLHVVTAIKTAEAVDVYHVWIAEGKGTGKVAVYDAASKTLRDADASELAWLKEREIERRAHDCEDVAQASPR